MDNRSRIAAALVLLHSSNKIFEFLFDNDSINKMSRPKAGLHLCLK